MQVDLVITELEVGGAESALTNLAIGLQSHGDDVRVFSLGPTPVRSGCVDRLREHDIDVQFGSGRSVWRLPWVASELRRWLRQRPDSICQSFLFHANVLTGWTIDRPERHVAGIRVAESRPARLAIERRAISRSRSVVCVSGAVAKFASDHLGLDAARCEVIGNGVDASKWMNTSPIDWTRFGLPADVVVTLYVGRFHPQKGLDHLQRQVDVIAPAGSNRKLVLIGDGVLAESLTTWAGDFEDRVWVLPWMSDVASAMRGSRVLVLPSRFEGMPNVVLEAMAAGRPVVCSDVEGIDELLGDDDSQRFVSGDEEMMAKRIREFANDADLADTVGKRNQVRALNQFTLDVMVDRYRQIYASMAR